ncbi:hypothetical protein QBC35DRAFT_483411 [Podospora australis]|uniref:NmrA-like domain-containing protein n=1 Tax=Podospora australis TaxID=1536484 RepID=A0AAN6X628_9PEZI|nr:hypothetical protein QBC35DRAFT_483411 [Podospora australis]
MAQEQATRNEPILVLGGTGTVGSRLAKQLTHEGFPVLVASRNGKKSPSSPPSIDDQHATHVTFDWNDPDTWNNVFTAAKDGIRSVYLIAPPGILDGDRVMTEFIDFARDRGARRFVLQSASSIEAGGPVMGKVHAYLRELGTQGEVEWGVVRPTWFQQNLAEQANHANSIRDESKLYSATSEGKIPWVSADDIAAVAMRLLTNVDPPNTEYVVLGPELLSYEDIAQILSEVLGRKIVHVDLTTADLEKRHTQYGMPVGYAKMMSALDTSIKFGAENRTNDVILSVTGAAPRKFRDYALSVKDVWVGA